MSPVPPGPAATETPTVSRLFLHPVKSCGTVEVDRIWLDEVGPDGDRRWMVVSAEDGEAVTQRHFPELALVRPSFVTGGPGGEEEADPWAAHGDRPGQEGPAEVDDGSVGPGGLLLEAPDRGSLIVWEPGDDAPARTVRVWGDEVEALDAGEEAAVWFSGVTEAPVRLVRLPDDHRRPVARSRVRDGFPSRVAFADGFPLLVVSEESIAELNRRLETRGERAVGVERFRPNVVVRAGSPHAEDDWEEIRMGEVRVALVKPCARCSVVTVDPGTGERGKEPLRTLATYRKSEHGVLMGQNGLHAGPGVLRTGDAIVVEKAGREGGR